MSHWKTLRTVMAVLVAAQPCFAGSLRPVRDPERLSSLINSQKEVRVRLDDSYVILHSPLATRNTLEFTSYVIDSPRLVRGQLTEPESPEGPLLLSDIPEIQVRRNYSPAGTVLGIVAGVLAGATLGSLVALGDWDSRENAPLYGAVGGAIILGAIGAGTGSGGWDTVYNSPKP